jgi:hypothetical protein
MGNLPRATVVSLPPEKPRPVGEVVATVLDMLEHGDVERAIAMRAQLDTAELADLTDGIKLARLREMLGVAKRLPGPVVIALAQAIAGGDLATARPAFELYAHTNPTRARKARHVLVARAPELASHVEHWLWVPIAAPAPASRTNAGGISIASSLVMIGFLGSRCATVSTSHYEIPKFNLPAIHLNDRISLEHMRLALHPDQPPPFDPAAAPVVNEGEIGTSTLAIVEHGSVDQAEAAHEVANAAFAQDCPRLRAAVSQLDYAMSPTVSPYSGTIATHVAAIHVRSDAICP